MKRCGILLLTFLLLFVCMPTATAAQTASFTMRAEEEAAVPGEEVRFLLSCTTVQPGNLSACRIRMPYDETQLQFRKVTAKGGLTSGELETNVKDGVITIVYLTGREGIAVGREETPLMEISFIVLSDIPQEEVLLSAEVDGACDYDLTPYELESRPSARLPVERPPQPNSPQDALLRALQPDTGTLEPAFDPERFSYTLEVPSTVTSVLFYAQPMREDATVKVNRKTLGAMGSTTRFTVTVTSPDKSQKQVYEVSVNRGEKPVAGSVSSSKGKIPSQTVSRSSSGKTSSVSKVTGDGSSGFSIEKTEGDATAGVSGLEEGQEALQLPLRQGNQRAFLLGIAAAVCVGVAVILLFWRKNRPKEKQE